MLIRLTGKQVLQDKSEIRNCEDVMLNRGKGAKDVSGLVLC